MSRGHIAIFPKGEPYEFSPKLKNNKKGLFDQLAILVFFQRGDPINLVQNEKLAFGLLLEEIGLEIMFGDRLVTNRALLN